MTDIKINNNECNLSKDSIYSPRSHIPSAILKTKQKKQIEKQILDNKTQSI